MWRQGEVHDSGKERHPTPRSPRLTRTRRRAHTHTQPGAPTCAGGHGLKRVPPNSRAWACDAALGPDGPAGCLLGLSKAGVGTAGVAYFRCDACDYDLCER